MARRHCSPLGGVQANSFIKIVQGSALEILRTSPR